LKYRENVLGVWSQSAAEFHGAIDGFPQTVAIRLVVEIKGLARDQPGTRTKSDLPPVAPK
jgi:hypothetical protein